jgi:excisionase family DNA binding protein
MSKKETNGKMGAGYGLVLGNTAGTVPDGDGDRLLKIPEAANVLAISVRALYRLIADGDIPVPVKIGRATRVPASDLLAYMGRLKANRGVAAA